mmetsp:Transcript_23552/g.65530  ORF Transcript_23552/g.65530 Transcript_23552/m.65530 type:complete len:87 (+) Transcript_23552:284-544(+)
MEQKEAAFQPNWWRMSGLDFGSSLPSSYDEIPLSRAVNLAITNNGVLGLSSRGNPCYDIIHRYSCSTRHALPMELGVLFVQTVMGA